MLTLQQIQEQAYATAREKGWHERPLREPALSETERREAMTQIASVTPYSVDELLAANDRFRDAFGIERQQIIYHDRVLAKHALMHTELTEAHDCAEAGEYGMYFDDEKPEGFAVEIADLIIRICDTTAALGLSLTLSPDRPSITLSDAKGYAPACEIRANVRGFVVLTWLGKVRQYIDQATEAARVDAWDEYAKQLTLAVLYAASIVIGCGQDIDKAVEAKMAYNKTRPHRHGGKQA